MNTKAKAAVHYYPWLLVAFVTFGAAGVLFAQSQEGRPELTKDQCEELVRHQSIVADPGIFSAETFPKIDFLNKDLVKAALGPYALNVRYFDAAYNELQKPAAPGRYGAWVEVHFPNGVSDTRQLTLFKSAMPYKPRKDPFRVQADLPAAFAVPPQVVEREQWNVQDFINGVFGQAYHQDDEYAVLTAALHDLGADPARWHGFGYWHIDDAWWTGLETKLGIFREYQRLVRVPADYEKTPDKQWPLILFLHGSGERGDDLDKVKDQGPLGYINAGHPLPFVVVAPQCPRREWWNPERLKSLIDQIQASYRIDPKRIYVTGLSMGGYATFDLAAVYPQLAAAIAPLSGGENPEIAERLKGIPTWIFHGADDDVVPARYSIDIADRMKALGLDVKLTIYPGVGHGGWDKVYGDPALYDWFLQHSLK